MTANLFQVESYEKLFQVSEDKWREAMRVEKLLMAQIEVLQDQLGWARKNTEHQQAEMKRAAQWLLDNDPAMIRAAELGKKGASHDNQQ